MAERFGSVRVVDQLVHPVAYPLHRLVFLDFAQFYESLGVGQRAPALGRVQVRDEVAIDLGPTVTHEIRLPRGEELECRVMEVALQLLLPA